MFVNLLLHRIPKHLSSRVAGIIYNRKCLRSWIQLKVAWNKKKSPGEVSLERFKQKIMIDFSTRHKGSINFLVTSIKLNNNLQLIKHIKSNQKDPASLSVNPLMLTH